MLWGAIDSTHQSVGVGGGGTRPNDCTEVACLSAASQQNAKLRKAAVARSNKRGSYSVLRKIHYSACPSFTPAPMLGSGEIGIKKERRKETNILLTGESTLFP